MLVQGRFDIEWWLFHPDNSSVVEGWSFLLATLGFGITFWQIWRAGNAARAAERAAKESKAQALRFDAVFEMARVTGSLREALRHINDDGWGYAAESIGEAQFALVRLSELHDGFEDAERGTLQNMNDKLGELRSKISSKIAKGVRQVSKPLVIEILGTYQVELAKLGTKFEKSAR